MMENVDDVDDVDDMDDATRGLAAAIAGASLRALGEGAEASYGLIARALSGVPAAAHRRLECSKA